MTCIDETFNKELDEIYYQTATKCKKCDMAKTADDLAVIVQCYQCFDEKIGKKGKKSSSSKKVKFLIFY